MPNKSNKFICRRRHCHRNPARLHAAKYTDRGGHSDNGQHGHNHNDHHNDNDNHNAAEVHGERNIPYRTYRNERSRALFGGE
jgi:hypothetical protein